MRSSIFAFALSAALLSPGVAAAEILGQYDVMGVVDDTPYAGKVVVTQEAPGLIGIFTNAATGVPPQRMVGFADGDGAVFAFTTPDGAAGAMIVRKNGKVLEASYVRDGDREVTTETWMRLSK